MAAVVDREDGQLLGTKEFSTTRAGYRALLRWMRDLGGLEAVGAEGTGSRYVRKGSRLGTLGSCTHAQGLRRVHYYTELCECQRDAQTAAPPPRRSWPGSGCAELGHGRGPTLPLLAQWTVKKELPGRVQPSQLVRGTHDEPPSGSPVAGGPELAPQRREEAPEEIPIARRNSVNDNAADAGNAMVADNEPGGQETPAGPGRLRQEGGGCRRCPAWRLRRWVVSPIEVEALTDIVVTTAAGS